MRNPYDITPPPPLDLDAWADYKARNDAARAAYYKTPAAEAPACDECSSERAGRRTRGMCDRCYRRWERAGRPA